MSVINNNLLLTADAAAASSYQVSRSLRFNTPDSAYLNRTPSVAGNQTTWTWSGWVKRSTLGTFQGIFGAGDGQNSGSGVSYFTGIAFNSSNIINCYWASSAAPLASTTAVFRDTGAWYHIVCSAGSNLFKLYVNGTLVLSPSISGNGAVNGSYLHGMSILTGSPVFAYANAYLAEVYFIDGQALTPSSFTETNATTGQLVPKTYSGGSYGVNGFRLNFSDNSAATAATLGADSSGNGNNWTPNNLSVNAGGQVSISASTGALPVYNTTDTYGAVKGTGTRTDSNSSSLVLAVPMDGANNGTTFTDESAAIRGSGTAKAITVVGNTKTLTAQSKFYGSSGFFDGTGDYLPVTNSVDFDFSSGAYTIEVWAYPTDVSTLRTIVARSFTGGTGNYSGFILTNQLFLETTTQSSWNVTINKVLTANVWQHLAVVRNGNTWTYYVNGISVGTSTASGSVPTGPGDLEIGRRSGASDFLGYLQDLRFYKGVAKYTSNFTPPTATQNTAVAAGCDSLTDTPTSYGTDTGAGAEVRGNYATLNPLQSSASNLSNGNLAIAQTVNAWIPGFSTIGINTGKWFWEVTWTSGTNTLNGIAANPLPATYIGSNSTSLGLSNDAAYYKSGATTSYGTSFSVGAVIGHALDVDAGTIVFYVNGVSKGSIAYGFTGTIFPAISVYGATSENINFGQRPFAYAAPSGFKALCDTNIPAPTIAKGSSVFDTTLYTGTGAALTPTSSLAFSPDLVWIKGRSGATDHALYDTVRGATFDIVSNSTAAETTQTQGLTAFNSNGFTVGTLAKLNTSAATYAGWAWDAGSSTVTNTAGTITSQVRANASAGFSVVTYTGTGANGTIGHGLGIAPEVVIIKRRDANGNWQVRHVSIAAASSIQLNLTNASASATTVWNSTAPSSSVFSVGTDATVNASAGTYVAYCFAPVTGYSSFGSYTGNGSADGPFVYLGFRPAFLMMKRTNAVGNWIMLDSKREGYNVDNDPLYANLTNVEGTDDLADITSNGFKLRSTNADCNASAGTYIYAAFAENPFQYARAR